MTRTLTSRIAKIVAGGALVGSAALTGSAVLAVGASPAGAETTHLTTVNMGNIATVCRAHSGKLIVGSAGTNCILPGNVGVIECWQSLGCDLITLHVSPVRTPVLAPEPIGIALASGTK